MQLRGIDTNLVVALRALLAHRNVTRAGKAVGLSQSSMSHALSRLRAHFDDPLLVPVGRELVLTERAKELVEPVAEAIAKLERVFTPPAAFDPKTSRRLFRIAATDNLGLYALPKLAAMIQKSAPAIDIRVSALPADWSTALKRGDIDLKLGRKYAVDAALESQDLSEERFGCVVRRGHPARSKPSLEDYAALEHLFVATSTESGAGSKSTVDAILAKHGLRRRVRMTVPHFLVAPHVVASSDLALTAPLRLLAPFVKSLGLRKLELPFELPGYVLSQVWSTRSSHDEAHRWLRGEVVRCFSSAPK
ncbi:Transcriptional regulator, LysR family [Labilithrix luteola]|uniref:Transcriptional regulator, LysR family n=1 Tax=Labilithrix luteola TaxID=1391654 RepID=A0A0K1Q077_9BACT|nr:LysR family transcriptional regulator [Labilithrix luteola]AKU98794.1 Transcriptional regulator, LysR family [Labilithrix luteola]